MNFALRHPVVFVGHGILALVLLFGGAAVGRVTAPQPSQDFSQRDQAVSVVAGNIGETVTVYDITWDKPLSTDSVTLDADGNSVVTEHVEAGGYVYTLRGVVSPTGILVGHIKEVSHYKVRGYAS